VTSERGIALVRRPSPRLAEGIVTHIERTPVDVDLAVRQHAAYVEALANHGWRVHPVAPADDCPDSVFVEDTVVICDDLAVLTRPGAPSRRPEISALASAVQALGLRVATIEAPGTLDGGDVLQIGPTVYVGHGGRTNAEGIKQLAAQLTRMGRSVVQVELENVLHLKSAVTALPDGTVLNLKAAVTALPDGTVLTWGGPVSMEAFSLTLDVPEEAGAHVVPLGGEDVLIAASAPATASLLVERGYHPVVVDISEFERLEGCVTCLNVLIPGSGR
jgi:dimethylargininase